MNTPSSSTSLLTLQRAFAARTTRGADSPGLAARIRTDVGIPADERLFVYANAWFVRLHEVLREDYGALAAALGEEAFHDLAKLYFMAHPPRHRSLRFAGAGLAAFLRGPVAELFARRWPFAADLADLEWALVDVFDASDDRLLERPSLLEVPPERWAGLRLTPIAAHRLLRLDWPVHDLRTAWSADRARPALSPAATGLLVYRRDERVYHRAVDAVEELAWQRLCAGDEFGALCEKVSEIAGVAEGATRLVALIERWIAEGLLVALDASAPGRTKEPAESR